MLVWIRLITNSDKNTKESMKKDFSFKSSSASVQVRRNTALRQGHLLLPHEPAQALDLFDLFFYNIKYF